MPSACMSRKKLHSALQSVKSFAKPKVSFEQYPTSAHVAADVLFNMQLVDDSLEGHSVADFGCGPGILSIGARLLGASYVAGFDIDVDAVADFQQNLELFDMERDCVDVVLCDVTHLKRDGENRPLFDTVILNPPFGTSKENTGIDMRFLQAALSFASSHVYSMHKTSTREHVLRTIRASGAKTEVVAELRFDIPRLYKKHRQESVDVKVDFIHSWF